MKKSEYVYEDLKFEYEPFYVGRGKNYRYKVHIQPHKLKQKNEKNKTLNEIIDNGLIPEIVILYSGLTFVESNNVEREIINKIGRIKENGPLTNITSGGQGNSDSTVSLEIREKIRKTMKDNGVYERISEKMKGEGNSMFGEKWHRTEEGIKSFSEKMCGVYSLNEKSEEEKSEIYNKISNTLKGRKLTDEQIELRKKNSKKEWQKPKNVKIVNIITNEIIIFDSINKASVSLNVCKETLKYRYNKNIIINNIKIESIE